MVPDHVTTGPRKKRCVTNNKSVKFSTEPPTVYAPSCITPEESSESSEEGSEDGSESSFEAGPTPPPSPPQLPLVEGSPGDADSQEGVQ